MDCADAGLDTLQQPLVARTLAGVQWNVGDGDGEWKAGVSRGAFSMSGVYAGWYRVHPGVYQSKVGQVRRGGRGKWMFIPIHGIPLVGYRTLKEAVAHASRYAGAKGVASRWDSFSGWASSSRAP